MSRLPVLSGEKLCAVFSRVGYVIHHQTGSHIILRHRESPHHRLTIPNHREISRGTLRAILKQAGLTVDEFVDIMK